MKLSNANLKPQQNGLAIAYSWILKFNLKIMNKLNGNGMKIQPRKKEKITTATSLCVIYIFFSSVSNKAIVIAYIRYLHVRLLLVRPFTMITSSRETPWNSFPFGFVCFAFFLFFSAFVLPIDRRRTVCTALCCDMCVCVPVREWRFTVFCLSMLLSRTQFDRIAGWQSPTNHILISNKNVVGSLARRTSSTLAISFQFDIL